MILGNNEKFKGIGYVCYIDVLGFSDNILKNWNSQTSNPLEKILSIKREMPIFTEIEDDGQENSRKYVCRVNTVSDSVTICFGFNDEIIVGDLVLGLEAVLGNISYIWSMFIMNGYTIRGAIEFGDVYWDESDLIGPAFINAYRLESEVAKNSRILVSSNLNRVFSNLVKHYDSSLTAHVFKYFRKDVDGYIIVDPNILYKSDSERSDRIEELKKSRDAVSSGIVREKYNPLISMLSEGTSTGLKYSDIGSY
ncbi:hypothetical protein RSJ42_08980 [Methanosarcina hadiensis]|uniref:hypothetical protein n=1 Tax=Methanosarcina hadiensis TaxID=3078083 RepID=UPI003977D9CE